MEKTMEKGTAPELDTVTGVQTSNGEALAMIDPAKEAKMMRKFDFYAVGLLGILYMSNIGNANIAGLPEDTGLVGNQYGTAVTLLYATYVPFEGPVAVLLKIIGPKYLLTGCCFCWGMVCLCTAFIENWQGLYACRMLIGFFEAGLIPCINVYIGLIYKKSERGKRSAVIFAFSALASAFGGIFAFALTRIHTGTYFSTWRSLFIIEGIITILVSPAFFFLFPDTPTTAWFLTPEEKELMKLRYELNPHWGHDEEFSWKSVRAALTDPKFFAFWIFQFSVDISLYGFTTFLPAIIKGLGYTSINANLLTVPIYFWGLLTFGFTAYMSDKTANRGYWIGGPLLCLIVGYAMLISVENLGVRYFACFITVMGIYPTTGMSIMWLSDNVAQHFKRATMVGGTLTLGNTAGVAVGQIFTSADSPRYIKGLSISMGLAAVALVMVASLMVGMHMVNKKREAKIRAAEEAGTPLPERPEEGDYDVHFKYSL
ncbi:Uu.00g079170.m01.CDS01 [Anthostomella pinea]|uniref:Uu.00g079170.m01.CDS01 n=1 Tax=Anthostomella pinea TaxID=933095 RepID=A0AAI8VLQ0_9PEZI|nr:Uu.00g079170.m01.CDS01 [Anthostomella pinea]